MADQADGAGPREDLLCPSAPCEPGALLLGLVGRDGRLGYVRPALDVDEDFVAKVRGGRAPEKRFRFAQPCRESGCRHWGDGRCRVADAAAAGEEGDADSSLPACAIRRRCRWFAQSGADACRSCPVVVTDVTSSEEWRQRQPPGG